MANTTKFVPLIVMSIILIGCVLGGVYLALNTVEKQTYHQKQNTTSCYKFSRFDIEPSYVTGYEVACLHEKRECKPNTGTKYFQKESFVNYTCEMIVITSGLYNELEIVSYEGHVLDGIYFIVLSITGLLMFSGLVTYIIWLVKPKINVIEVPEDYIALPETEPYRYASSS
jgi:hypothetical protein